MVAGGLPSYQVLLDDGTGTFPYDITAYVRLVQGWSIQRGRQDELAAVTPGSLSLTLDNADGRFTIGSTLIASPSPIKVDARIRVNEAANLPTRTNLVTNPSFEVDTTGWANNNNASLARSTVQSYVGSAALQVTATAAAADTVCWNQPSRQPVTPGATYTAQAQVLAATVGRNVQLALCWLDSSGASISYVTGSQVADVTTGWVRASVTATAPTGAASAAVAPWVIGCAANEAHFVDAVMIEQGATPGAYFDGSTAAAAEYTYAWTGTANASTSTATARKYTRHTGYVVSWPVAWPSGDDGFSIVTVTATDAQARAQRWTLKSVVEQELLADGPVVYYPLNEATGATSASDASGNNAVALAPGGDIPPYTTTVPTFGNSDGPGAWSPTAANFTGGGQFLISGAQNLGTIALLEIAFNTTSLPVMPSGGTWVTGGSTGLVDSLGPGSLFIGMNASGQLTGKGAFGSLTGPVVNDGKWHLASLRYNGTTVDLLLDGSVVASVASTLVGEAIPAGINVAPNLTGAFAHVILYPTDPGATRIAAHASAVLTGFGGQSGTSSITRFAGYAGVPTGTLDTSLTNTAYLDIAGSTAWDSIQKATDAELGLTFVDGSGNLTFHNRQRVPTKTTPDFTLDANYVDPATAFATDMQNVFNYVEATAVGTGITQIARDATSESSHGRYPTSLSYLVQSNAEALDRASWIVATHKEPGPRAGSLVFDLLTMTATQQAQALALEPDSWVQITGLPSQTPGGTTANFIVQGFTENLSADAWTLTLNVADKATVYPHAFILDSSTLDSGDRLYL